MFDRFDGGGDAPEVVDGFTAADLVAVSMLSVDVAAARPHHRPPQHQISEHVPRRVNPRTPIPVRQRGRDCRDSPVRSANPRTMPTPACETTPARSGRC